MKLIDEIRAKIAQLLDERAAKQTEMDAIVSAAEERGSGDLTEEESQGFDEVRSVITEIDKQRAKLEERVETLEGEEESRKAADEARKRYETDPEGRTDPTPKVNEPLTFRKGGRHSFFSDAFRAVRLGDFAAQDRLRAHQREMEVIGAELRSDPEQRDVGTSAFGALVVPQFLVDEFAPVLRNGRAFANAVRSEPLPEEGMTVTIPRGETGVTVAPQATENAAVSETDVDYANDLDINVRTFAGQQDVSRQTLERGTPGIDRILYADLVAAYAANLDRSVIADDGTLGTHKGVLAATGVNSVAYTSAAPTVVEAWPKIANAVGLVGSNRKMPANLIAMTPLRWAWFLAALDTADRPLIISGDPAQAFNAMGLQPGEGGFGEGQLVGTLQGNPVLVDGNIPANLGAGTNEDRIIGLRRQDLILWEEGDGMPRELRFEETAGGNLTVKLVVYGYSAFTAERYAVAVSVIAGTGLVAPIF